MGYSIAQFPQWVRDRYNEEVLGKRKRKNWSKDQSNRSQRTLVQHIQLYRLPTPLRDYRLAAAAINRNWQADFAWISARPGEPKKHLAVFLDGLVHKIEEKRTRDCERDNVLPLVLKKWTLMKFTAQQVQDLIAVDAIAAWLEADDAAVLAALQRKPKW